MFPWIQIGKTKEKKTRPKILPILNHSSDFLDLILICKSSLTGKECFFSFKWGKNWKGKTRERKSPAYFEFGAVQLFFFFFCCPVFFYIWFWCWKNRTPFWDKFPVYLMMIEKIILLSRCISLKIMMSQMIQLEKTWPFRQIISPMCPRTSTYMKESGHKIWTF